MELKVLEQDSKFLNSHPETYDEYVLVQSRNISTFNRGDDFFEGYVCVNNPTTGKNIVRRIVAHSSPGLDSGHAMLGSRTMAYLELKEYDSITIEPICKLKYLWKNSNSEKRISIKLAIWALVISILAFIVTILTL